MSELMRKEPGVVLLEGMKSGNRYWAAHGYQDGATYNKIMQDPRGAFSKALAEYQVDKIARWISSERGETLKGETGIDLSRLALELFYFGSTNVTGAYVSAN